MVSGHLLGRVIVTRAGTVRANPDYDDAWILACSQHAATIFDIGAHTGYSALLMLMNNPKVRMILVEANPEALSICAENLIHNHLASQCSFVWAFAAEHAASSVRFWTTNSGAASSMYRSHAQTASKLDRSIEVPTVTVDALCERYALLPDFVKIDVEGAEHKVLLGSRQCAARKQTRFLVEMHATVEHAMYQNATAVLDWCADMGYTAWYLAQHTRLARPQTIQGRGRCHLLLQPDGWPFPEWLQHIEQAAPLQVAST